MPKLYVSGYDEMLNYGKVAVGNKAYNLALLSTKVDNLNLPKSAVLLSDANDIATAKKDISDYVISSIGYPLIARSSTTVEDSNDSFAGLFLSKVCYNKSELLIAIDNVLNSPLTEEVIKYCEFKRIDKKTIKVAILIQEYINPDVSGVMFTKHPLSNDSSIILIEYKEKTSDAVTGGTVIPHNMVIKKDKTISYNPMFNQLRSIALSAEDAFCYPLDIEWIFSDNKIWIVQIRQITT